jgi:hypothetical protein
MPDISLGVSFRVTIVWSWPKADIQNLIVEAIHGSVPERLLSSQSGHCWPLILTDYVNCQIARLSGKFMNNGWTTLNWKTKNAVGIDTRQFSTCLSPRNRSHCDRSVSW